ncbi:hypothetical protein D3C81_2140360 [compost metagenome]
MPIGEKPIRVHAIHVVGGGIRLTGAERHFHRFIGETGIPQEAAAMHTQAPQLGSVQLRLQRGRHRR